MQDAYIQERSDAMENIHSTIVELGTIFRQLAEMVQQQEEQVARWSVRETLPLLLIDGRFLSEIISMVSLVMLTNDDWWAVLVVS